MKASSTASNKISDIYPVGYLQAGMLLEAELSNDGTYHDVFTYQVNMAFDYDKFFNILSALIKRHELLRASFIQSEDYGYLSVIHRQVNVADKLFIHSENCDESVFLEKEKHVRFNYKKAGLYRFFILNQSDSSFTLVFSFHHAITDGWSVASLITELTNAYVNNIAISKERLPKYGEFIQKELHAIHSKKHQAFWKKYLSNCEVNTSNLKLDTNTKTKEKDGVQIAISHKLSAAQNKQIFQLANEYNTTVDVIFISLYQFMLSVLFDKEDITIGLVVNNRLEKEGGDKLFGLHLNTIPLRQQMDNKDIDTLIKTTRDNKTKVYEYKSYPYGKLKADLNFTEDIYQCVFNYMHFHIIQGQYKNQSITSSGGFEKTNIPLAMHVFRGDDAFTVRFSGSDNFIDNSTLARLKDYIVFYLEQLTISNDKTIALQRIPTAEYQQIIYDWNNTDKVYPKHKTIPQLFEEQAAKTPNNVALAFDNEQLTYQELNEKANQLARYIRKQKVIQSDTLIALCLDRSIDMLVGILGVLKAGAAYVPISPDFPKERIQYILEDTNVELILTQSHYVEQLQSISTASILPLNNVIEDIYLNEKSTNLLVQNQPKDLAYVIYTSGTTGKPKGACLSHQNLNNLIHNQINKSIVKPNDKVLLFAALVFDASVWEMFSALACGASLYLIGEEARKSPDLYVEYLQKNKISTVTIPPVFLGILPKTELKSLKTLIVAGESCPEHLMIKWNNNRRFINAYGPTEGTVCATFHEFHNGDSNTNIGKPLDNVQCYVLNSNLQPVPVGVVGELHIGGESVARGYLNKPELTQEKFINHPFAAKKDAQNGDNRLYKTGDLVKWRPDGNLEYIGRSDFQVKIRGYRIELGEIEAVLNNIIGIKQARVLVYENDGNKDLLAYYVFENNKILSEEVIREQLNNHLPNYMIPSAFIAMKVFPLTVNGKLDTKALPHPDSSTNQDSYTAPSTKLEKQLCSIFQKVLGRKKVSVKDDFFRIGGNSILAIKTAHRISRAFDTHFPVADLFNHKTVAALATNMESNREETINIIPQTLARYPLSFAQRRLWFIEQFQEGSSAYHMPIVLELAQDTNKEQLKNAIQELIQRHEILRTILQADDGDYYQIVQNNALTIKEYHFNETDISTQIKADVEQSFDLEKEYPIRVCFYQESDKNLMLLNLHHIATDGWSMGIVLKEIEGLYYHKTLSPLAIQYKDYAAWQRTYLQGDILTKQLTYWSEQLKGVEPLALPTDKVRPVNIDYTGNSIEFNINKNLSKRLRYLSKENGSTLYTTLLSGFYILLYKYTGQDDIVVGSPVAGRNYKEIEDLIGFFINSLALREHIDATKTITALINQVQKNLVEAQRHQDLPFEKLVDELNVERDSSRHPIFQVMFGVQSFGSEATNTIFQPANIDNGYQIAKFDLNCFLDDSKEEIIGLFNYATSLFEQETIERMVNHYLLILEQMVSNEVKEIKDYTLLTSSEYNLIINDWNKTDKPYPKQKTIQQSFEEQVARTPNNVALIFESERLTYKELNQKVNQLARHIQQKVTPKSNAIIALYTERGIDMIVGVLGILKSGAAYVPINPTTPKERIKYILEDTKVELILTQSHLENSIKEVTDTQLIALDSNDFENESIDNLSIQSKPTDLAYVIYTSGTTGKPKGVMIEHHSVLNLCQWHETAFGLTTNSKATFYANITFDAAVWEMFPYLLSGGCLYPLNNDIRTDIQLLTQLMERESITHAFLPTGIYEQLIEIGYTNDDIQFLTGGDKLRNYDNASSIVNNYGPTETTVVATSTPLDGTSTEIPIGKPIDNTKVYVLDANHIPVPVGIVGELYIGGAGVAKGYLNNVDLTQKRFINNPFANQTDIEKGYNRLYKTNDLVKWRPDGNLEYIGRNDFQVKIRGYRIELGEIETAIKSIEEIHNVCVLAKEKEGIKYLVAYYITNDKSLTETSIVEKLNLELLEYMIPSAFVKMDSFPLTVNGKLNRKAFPNPTFNVKDEYVCPTSEEEISLCRVFEKVLGVEKVGMTDNFFRIGGNSILAIKLSHQINQSFNIHLPIADIFRYPTVAGLVRFVTKQKDKAIQIEPQILEHYPLSFAQERLWFIEQFHEGSNAYHIPVLLELAKDTDKEKLKNAIQHIAQRHEILRTVLEEEDGIYYQKVLNEPLIINEYNFIETDITGQIERDINTPFDLKNEYPIRVCFYHDRNKLLLLLNLHHITSDGWSTDILLREMTAFYNNQSLPTLAIQYKDYANWQRNYLQGEVLEEQLQYWKEQLNDVEPLVLPTDKARPREIDYTGDNISFNINKDLSARLRALSKAEGCTLYTTLLSGYYIFLSKYSGQNDIVVGMPMAGRNYKETDNLIGLFINNLALRQQIGQKTSASELILEVQNNLTEAQNHRDLPFEKLVEELQVERDNSRHPIFQAMFGVHSFAVEKEEGLFKPAALNDAYQIAKFDLNCQMDDSNEEIFGILNYATALFDKSTIERMANHYLLILEQMVNDSKQAIQQYNILTSSDKEIINQANSYQQPAVKESLVGMCLSSIEKYSDNLAVIDHIGNYTYRDTGNYSYNIASYLHENRLSKRNQMVGILSEKGLNQVVSTLGIMQSGAGYLPLHIDWPIGRIDIVLIEGLVQTVLVSQAQYTSNIQGSEIESKYNWLIIEEIIHDNSFVNTTLSLPSLDDIAYVIFTSGSTGKPKGVTISHRGAANTIEAVNAQFNVKSSDKILALSELSFDLSVYDIFGLLAAGGTIVFPEQSKTKEPGHWYDLVATHGITIWDSVPQLMQLLVDYTMDYNLSLDALRVVMMSGDWIPVQLPNEIKSINPSTTVMSLGGATEGSIWSIWYEVNEVKSDWTSIPYGQAMPNQKMYVLDEYSEHCPVGITGEIHIGGEGVALNYWNNEEKTNASYFEHKTLGRLYKTGDLGRWHKASYIEFQGRKDNQVKLNGYRVELEEITYHLTNLEGIEKAAVRVYENRLLAYLVLTMNRNELLINDLETYITSHLKNQLPEYMMPSDFMVLDAFPLTSNGKLNVKALPIPEFKVEDTYVPPTTPLEQQLCTIFQEVLNLEKVGLTDNFFKIGGNSILAIRLSHQMNKFDLQVTVADIFKYATIAEVSKSIEEKQQLITINEEEEIWEL